jgi:hypothetical protein
MENPLLIRKIVQQTDGDFNYKEAAGYPINNSFSWENIPINH